MKKNKSDKGPIRFGKIKKKDTNSSQDRTEGKKPGSDENNASFGVMSGKVPSSLREKDEEKSSKEAAREPKKQQMTK